MRNTRQWKSPRFYRRYWWLLSMFLWASLALLSRCVQLRMSDKQVNAYFADSPVKPAFAYIKVGSRTMHVAAIGADTLPMVVFVHGSPGSWDAFIGFFRDSLLCQRARIVSVDRPGFGKSDLGKPERDLGVQAAALVPVLQMNRSASRPILVGHSLGGPLVARMAMDYPGLVGGLILVAPSVDPALEPREWYRKAGNFFLIRPLLPVELDVSNQEILPLRQELERMLPRWSTLQIPITVIQGEADKLVPAGNAVFVARQAVNAVVQVVLIPGMNHFIPWKRPDLIREAILDQLENR
jgi:pimeloyl-ACP methyl ester carboxylesterase